jgi:hypothetical protein
MTMFLIETYIFFYIFSRIRFAYAKANSEGEEFAYKFSMIPLLIEFVAISLILLNFVDIILGKKVENDDEDS